MMSTQDQSTDEREARQLAADEHQKRHDARVAELSPLAQRLYSVVSEDDATAWAWEVPALPERARLSTFEFDLRDWGIVAGIAYGLVLAGDELRLADVEALRQEALDAAREVWAFWSATDLFTVAPFLMDRSYRPDAEWIRSR